LKVWIDCANSPHPLLFAPVARRLETEGHEVLVTARDHAQTIELARERWPRLEAIGGPSPRARAAKLQTIGRRVRELRRWAAATRPHIALSHNSYGQIVAARSLRIPSVTGMDFEHQPANHVAFRLARTILLPDVLPLAALRWQGAAGRKVVQYPGLKEELYIGDFTPDPSILAKLGLEGRPRIIVVVRSPPTRAVYHPSANSMFESVLRTICLQNGVACVALARHPEQTAAIEALGFRNLIVPRRAIDSRSLIYAADAIIGAGGTMTREAAVMGIPTWTMFAGTTPAVDTWLERQGMLKRLVTPDQLAELTPRHGQPRSPADMRRRGEAIERVFVEVTVASRRSAQRGLRTLTAA
jgi:uncharacterized protein